MSCCFMRSLLVRHALLRCVIFSMRWYEGPLSKKGLARFVWHKNCGTVIEGSMPQIFSAAHSSHPWKVQDFLWLARHSSLPRRRGTDVQRMEREAMNNTARLKNDKPSLMICGAEFLLEKPAACSAKAVRRGNAGK